MYEQIFIEHCVWTFRGDLKSERERERNFLHGMLPDKICIVQCSAESYALYKTTFR